MEIKKNIQENTTTFNVAVVATMSSGKSTILNALLGYDLLPSKNEACTAKLFKIKDIDGLTQFTGRTKDKNNDWSAFEPINKEHLNNWNSSNINEVEIHGDFPHINNLMHGKKILFYDTPGPNNSMDKSHYEISTNILNSSDYGFIIFAMNATQFGVDDERNLLELLLDGLNRNNKKHKIIFVVNKIDQFDLELGELPVDLIEKIKTYLSDIGFSKPVIVPTFAKISLDIRKILQEFACGDEVSMSKRQQKHFIADYEILQNNSEHYLDIFKNEERFNNSMQNALEQKRTIVKEATWYKPWTWIRNTKINIGEHQYHFKDFIKADLVTGIPVLEEFLEIELNKHFAE